MFQVGEAGIPNRTRRARVRTPWCPAGPAAGRAALGAPPRFSPRPPDSKDSSGELADADRAGALGPEAYASASKKYGIHLAHLSSRAGRNRPAPKTRPGWRTRRDGQCRRRVKRATRMIAAVTARAFDVAVELAPAGWTWCGCRMDATRPPSCCPNGTTERQSRPCRSSSGCGCPDALGGHRLDRAARPGLGHALQRARSARRIRRRVGGRGIARRRVRPVHRRPYPPLVGRRAARAAGRDGIDRRVRLDRTGGGATFGAVRRHRDGVARRARDGVHATGELPALVEQADAVVVLAPLAPQTTGLFDAALLARMRDGALLVNAGRGGVVDTARSSPSWSPAGCALCSTWWNRSRFPTAIRSGKPALAITPHNAGDTAASDERAVRFCAEQLARFARGEPLQNVVREAA